MKAFHDLFGSKPVLLAPMFEVTNLPFRLFCRMQGSSGGVSEFVSVNQLLYVYKNSLQASNTVQHLIKTIPQEKPVGLQLFGFDAQHFRQLSEVFDFSSSGFDFLDLNIGCPVPKICNIGAGSKLLQNENISKLEEILKTIRHSFNEIPFSIKIRAGYKQFLNLEKFSEMINAIDLSHVTIHPKLAINPHRDRSNEANHEISKEFVELVSHPVIINGGITSLEMTKKLLLSTKAAGAMIGRQAQKYPWVFNEKFQECIPTDDYIKGLNEFIQLNKYYGFGKLYMVRDQLSGMIRGFPGSKVKRAELQIKFSSLDVLETFIADLEQYFEIQGIISIKNKPDSIKKVPSLI